MKVIGVTPAVVSANNALGLSEEYLQGILRAGALPLVLPMTDNEEIMDAMMERIDGLLLSGGADVSPEYYGETRQPYCGKTEVRRDKLEFELCRRALERKMPILAICRGIQVLNCVMGGTLYQDIATQFGTSVRHPCSETPKDRVHTVTLQAGTRLRALVGEEQVSVNSRHHQAVKTLGRGLVASAIAQDGLIEAIELPGETFVVGVQWHPESLAETDADSQRLISAFVEACKP